MPPNFGIGMALKGKTLGIWGFGKIGQLVAGYGKAFGMHVIVWGSEASRARAVAEGHDAAESRDALFEAADVLSLHLRLADETRGIVKLDALSRMKPTALIVNTSRAELIEEGALVSALNRGRPGMAAVDVFEASRSCRAICCCASRTRSARRTSATSSRTATSSTSAPRSRTSSTSSRDGRRTSSIPRRSRCAIERAAAARRRFGRAGGAVSELRRRQVRWSLLFGNFVIGCGVMVVVGTLNDISRSLDVSVVGRRPADHGRGGRDVLRRAAARRLGRRARPQEAARRVARLVRASATRSAR